MKQLLASFFPLADRVCRNYRPPITIRGHRRLEFQIGRGTSSGTGDIAGGSFAVSDNRSTRSRLHHLPAGNHQEEYFHRAMWSRLDKNLPTAISSSRRRINRAEDLTFARGTRNDVTRRSSLFLRRLSFRVEAKIAASWKTAACRVFVSLRFDRCRAIIGPLVESAAILEMAAGGEAGDQRGQAGEFHSRRETNSNYRSMYSNIKRKKKKNRKKSPTDISDRVSRA